MSQVAISGNASGTGTLTIAAPNTNSNRTLTLPDSTGTLIAGTNGITAESNGGTGTTTGYYGFKNRIINGAMVIDQRNAGASVTVTAVNFSVDRFFGYASVTSKFTVQQNAGAVTPPVGFIKYLGATSSAATSLGAADFYLLTHRIEGFNIADLAWGTASAATVTLSFQVRSSLTGTFGGSLSNGSANRSYPFTYSIPVANTWTTISVTVAGDTSGTWATDNSNGMSINFGLGVGTTYSGTAGSWSGAPYFSATGATSVVGTNGATFYITGVQLEKGATATSFDYRPYGTELVLCQRYYQKSYNTDVAPGTNTTVGTVTFREYSTNTFLPNFATRLNTPLRATPTVVNWYTTNGILNSVSVATGSNTINTLYDYGMNSTGWMLINGSVSSGSQITAHYVVSAEL